MVLAIMGNENLFAHPMHWFSYKLNLVSSKLCDFAPIRNIFSILTKGCVFNQIDVNPNSKTGRNVKSILFR